MDINTVFWGSEALQKLQRLPFDFRSLFLLPEEIQGAEKMN